MDNGHIDKILEIKIEKTKMNGKHDKVVRLDDEKLYWFSTARVKKHSPNIIDLIEEGDYVNGKYVQEVKEYKDGKSILALIGVIDNEDIKSIVTKEQFASMEYRLEV